MDGENLNYYSNDQLEQLYDMLIKKYREARKTCHTMFLTHTKVWQDIFTYLKNKDDSTPLKSEYMAYQELINQLYYLLQIYGYIEFEKIQNIEDEQIKVFKENEILYFALTMRMNQLDQKLYREIFQYCYEQEYTQEFMFSLYEKFVGKLNKKYPDDYNQLLKLVQQQKQMLDDLYFCINYNGEFEFLNFI